MKRISIFLVSSLVLMTLMSGCSQLGLNPSGTDTNTANNTANNTAATTDNDNDDELLATIAKTIDTNGTHTITGTVDGQILVTADNVTLVLDGATINCTDSSAILGKDSNGAASMQNLTVELRGENSVTGSKHGIQGKDDLIITGSGTVKITSGKDGLHAGDTLTIKSGTLDISAGSDGMEAGNETDGTGEITLEDGSITINAGGGSSGTISATTSGGKGIKCVKDITITGGSYNIDSLDDSIHSNGNITISNGTLTLSSGDDGIHADGDLTISGGEITVENSYEGLEGTNVYISGGTMDLIAADDGINAAGGSSNGTDGDPGQRSPDKFAPGGGDYTIDISGGSIKFYSGGDGLDSNGTVNISGGTVVAIINSTPDNSALDSDGETTITGGTVIAGGTGTFENISGNSTQSYVYLTNISSGAKIDVQSGSTTLVSYTADADVSSLAVFSPGITSGQSYTVLINGQTSTVTAGTGGGRSMGGMGNMGGTKGGRGGGWQR